MIVSLEATLSRGHILHINWDEALVETTNAGFSLESPTVKDSLGLPLIFSDGFSPSQCRAVAQVLIAIAALSEGVRR